MQHDSHGLDLSTNSAAAARAFDHAVAGYIGYRADTGQRLAPLLAEDPQFALAHCLKGYLTMLSYKQANVPLAMASLQEARRWAGTATAREQAHVAALAAWIDGEPDRSGALWRQILAAHPRDALAFRLAHFTDFWLGRPDRMLSAVRAVELAWNAELPHYGTLLACRCFAHEECGLYTEAEAAGRAAIAHDPSGCVGRARRGARAGDAGPPRRGHRLDQRLARQLGRRQQSASPSVVARRDVSSGTRRDRYGPGAVRPRVPRPCRAADPGAAGSLYRRAERRVDAVPSAVCTASRSAIGGRNWPTRRRHASATRSRPLRCRTG